MADKVVETASTTPVEQSSPTPPTQPSTTGGKKSESTKRSRTKSSGSKRRKKKKRETLPEGFDQWPEVDQKYYQDISALLRDSKATRKQCSFTRCRLRWAYHPTHTTEISAYKKALKEVTPLGKTANLDVDF
uniref:40S ribosomal protein S25 n=1 Tax=Elaeophora elaphi TaxID=1147741 RepID=A0A0R3S0C5_9BILA